MDRTDDGYLLAKYFPPILSRAAKHPNDLMQGGDRHCPASLAVYRPEARSGHTPHVPRLANFKNS